jgi:hypothetical protein
VRPRHRKEGNVKIDLRETDWRGMALVRIAQDRNSAAERLAASQEKLGSIELVSNVL